MPPVGGGISCGVRPHVTADAAARLADAAGLFGKPNVSRVDSRALALLGSGWLSDSGSCGARLEYGFDQTCHLGPRAIVDESGDPEFVQIICERNVCANVWSYSEKDVRRRDASHLIREQESMHLDYGNPVLFRQVEFKDQQIESPEGKLSERRLTVRRLDDRDVLRFDHRAKRVTDHAALMRD